MYKINIGLLHFAAVNSIYSKNCCSTKTRYIKYYSYNDNIKNEEIIEQKNDVVLDSKDERYNKFLEKNKDRVIKMINIINKKLQQKDIEEILKLLYILNQNNYYTVVYKLYKILNISEFKYINIIKFKDLVYLFISDNYTAYYLSGEYYFYRYKSKKDKNNFFCSDNSGAKSYNYNILGYIIEILYKHYLDKDKNIPIKLLEDISYNIYSFSNYCNKIELESKDIDKNTYIEIDKKKDMCKEINESEYNELIKNNVDKTYVLIKLI